MAYTFSGKRRKDQTCKELRYFSEYLTEAFVFMHQYGWMSNSYVAEFFTQDLWLQLPLSWRECLEKSTLEDIANNVLNDRNISYSFVWPLSLLAFVATCHSLALNREQLRIFNCDEQVLDLNRVFTKHIKPKKRHELSVLPQVINSVCKETESRHVVDVGAGLGHLSRMLAYKFGLDITAVEMASQQLPKAEKFDKEMGDELKRLNINAISKNISQFGEVTHIAKKIQPNISAEEFITLISNSNGIHSDEFKQSSQGDNNLFGKNEKLLQINESSSKEKNCVLVGLHTCGDLASTMLQVFNNTPLIRGLVSVSCCYFRMTLKETDHKERPDNRCDCSYSFTLPYLYKLISHKKRTSMINEELTSKPEDSCSCKVLSNNGVMGPPFNQDTCCCFTNTPTIVSEDDDYGFPLSEFLRSFPYQPLKYKSFETACHFVDDYAKKLLDHSPNLKLHCYRAVMEVFIRHVDPQLVLAAIRCKKIKNAAQMTFIEYAEKVFGRLEKKFDPKLLEEINFQSLLSQWKNVVVYHSLVLLLGPVVESIALVDKIMFLKERGIHASLTPIFDPSISPRNFVLIASRD